MSASCSGNCDSCGESRPSSLFCRAWRQGKFLAGPVVQGPEVDWQYPASLVDSTPRFLSAKRSAVSSRREEIACVALAAQHNTRVCGPLCDPMGSSQVVLTLSGSPTVFYWYSLSGLQLQPGLQLIQRSSCRATNLQSFAAARHFCSAKILAGELRW